MILTTFSRLQPWAKGLLEILMKFRLIIPLWDMWLRMCCKFGFMTTCLARCCTNCLRNWCVVCLWSNSDGLREALGLRDDQLPPYIYQMRVLGYPPGWLEEARMATSGLALFDKHGQGEFWRWFDNGHKWPFDDSFFWVLHLSLLA